MYRSVVSTETSSHPAGPSHVPANVPADETGIGLPIRLLHDRVLVRSDGS